MKIFHTRQELINWRQSITKQTVGFVPTMGFLHEGHLRLVERARESADIVVMSIFVNQKQFNDSEDFINYPCDLERDTRLAEANGVDIVFIPSDKEMYPEKLTSKITITSGVDVLDGPKRPGHFDGVALILFKLFALVQPTCAYFGQKDAQQVAVVKGIVRDYFLPIKIETIKTVREADGLAKSSRNVNLTPAERKQAPLIHQALLVGCEKIAGGETNQALILTAVREKLGNTLSTKIDYLALYEYPSFTSVTDFKKPLILAIAVQFSEARLIDNEVIGEKGEFV